MKKLLVLIIVVLLFSTQSFAQYNMRKYHKLQDELSYERVIIRHKKNKITVLRELVKSSNEVVKPDKFTRREEKLRAKLEKNGNDKN